jgi:hypothetical protein
MEVSLPEITNKEIFKSRDLEKKFHKKLALNSNEANWNLI